jgi:hypothetical protein
LNQVTDCSSKLCRLIYFFGGTTELTNLSYINKHNLFKSEHNWFQGELIKDVILDDCKLRLVSKNYHLKRCVLQDDEYIKRDLLKSIKCIEHLGVYYDDTYVYILMPNLMTRGYEPLSNFLESSVSEDLKIQSIQMVAQDLKRLHSLPNKPVYGNVELENILVNGSEIVWINFELAVENIPAAKEYYQFISCLYGYGLKEPEKWQSVFEEAYQHDFPKEENEKFRKKWLP